MTEFRSPVLRRLVRRRGVLQLVALLVLLCLGLTTGFLLRGNSFALLRLTDDAPNLASRAGDYLLVCELPFCRSAKPGSLLLVQSKHSDSHLLRLCLAKAGDTLTFYKNRVHSSTGQSQPMSISGIRNIQALVIPRAGDTLHPSQFDSFGIQILAKILAAKKPSSRVEILNSVFLDKLLATPEQRSPYLMYGKSLDSTLLQQLDWRDLEFLRSKLQILYKNSMVEIRREIMLDGIPAASFTVGENLFFAVATTPKHEGDGRNAVLLPSSSIRGRVLAKVWPLNLFRQSL